MSGPGEEPETDKTEANPQRLILNTHTRWQRSPPPPALSEARDHSYSTYAQFRPQMLHPEIGSTRGLYIRSVAYQAAMTGRQQPVPRDERASDDGRVDGLPGGRISTAVSERASRWRARAAQHDQGEQPAGRRRRPAAQAREPGAGVPA